MTFHIGIHGPLASGKSTLAQTLKTALERRGYTVAIIPLAQEIKALVSRLVPDRIENYLETLATFDYEFGYTDCDAIERAVKAVCDAYEQYYTPNEKPRKLLQVIGTEIGRDMLDEDIWVKRVQLKKQQADVDIVITDDIRFDNEALAVDYLIKIDTSGRAAEYHDWFKSQFSNTYVDTNHASEQGISVQHHDTIQCGFDYEDVIALIDRMQLWLSA